MNANRYKNIAKMTHDCRKVQAVVDSGDCAQT